MQPLSPTASHRVLEDQTTQQTPTDTSHHGFPHQNLQDPPRSLSASPGRAVYGASDSHGQLGSGDDQPAGGSELSESGLAEYSSEACFSLEETESEISESKSGSPSLAASPLRAGQGASLRKFNVFQLPNEVLTHAFSHLPPQSLATVALVCRRFHELVTTPHAWRLAFARFFPGEESVSRQLQEPLDEWASAKRSFTRLTPLASWRSEYIVRTRLLRCLARGKPSQSFTAVHPGGASSRRSANSGQAHVTYDSHLLATVNHLQVDFSPGHGKKQLRFIHGADDLGHATLSDPISGKTDSWGQGDPLSFPQFSDHYPGVAMYGLGAAEIVGVPNVMDVSTKYGMLYGCGWPGGQAYYRPINERRGRFLAAEFQDHSFSELGVPRINSAFVSVCSVWIAKTDTIPVMSDGIIGMLVGMSNGVVSAHAFSSNNARHDSLAQGQLTARWVLSPGIPIVGLCIDEDYNKLRKERGRAWAVAVNALGECFYLTDFRPRRLQRHAQPESTEAARQADVQAWRAGRSVFWQLAEPTRRAAKVDPYERDGAQGSYSPRSSCEGMDLSAGQIAAETREIEDFLKYTPGQFQQLCEGWNMRRRLEVDFAGNGEKNACESFIVVECGGEGESKSSVRRYVRFRIRNGTESPGKGGSGQVTPPGPFAGVQPSALETQDPGAEDLVDVWKTTEFSFGPLKNPEFTTTVLDGSIYARTDIFEDPILSPSNTPTSSPPATTNTLPAAVPGQRARFLAAGTKLGSVLLWNVRAPTSSPQTPDLDNTITPLRVIHTDSPSITCLALSALYLVHGGSDGLVQAWDPLGSAASAPVRTLNSRFSARARRRLAQAEARPAGVGVNMFAAGALALDPDPTVLRGCASVGSHLRYWSYSSSAANQFKAGKRRGMRRRSERGSQVRSERFHATGRGELLELIESERGEMAREARESEKETRRLRDRFGVGMLGADVSEEELLAYATLLSKEEGEGPAEGSAETQAAPVAAAVTPTTSAAPEPEAAHDDDADMAEAIRLSLLQGADAGAASAEAELGREFTVRYQKPPRKSRSKSPPFGGASRAAESSAAAAAAAAEESDLEFALRLSLAEEESRVQARAQVETQAQVEDLYGVSDGEDGKGKGKERQV